jgi:hypothetical protein
MSKDSRSRTRPKIEEELERARIYRTNILDRLELALIRFRCAATAEDIQRLIYERGEERPVSDYLSALIGILNPPEAELDDAISVVQDAWNYLPHRILGDLSPAEVMIRQRAEGD